MRFPLLLAVAGSLLGPVASSSPASAGATSAHVPVRVPNVLGLSRAATFAAMQRAGLYFSTSGPGSATGTWSRVLSERPGPGTSVAFHSTIFLGVGPATRTVAPSAVRTHTAPRTPQSSVRVPNLTHMTRTQVYAVMRRAGLYFSTSGPGSTGATWRSVVKETPRPGTVVAHLSSVALVTSLQAPIARGLVRTPTLTGLDRSQVYAVMRRAGLYFTTVGAGAAWARVVSQSPRPGTPVRQRSTISLVTTGAVVTHTAAAVRAASPVHGSVQPVARPLTGSTQYRIGVATWYSYIPGRCATSYLPFGTRITVQDLDTGVTISCVVTDRQDYSPGRVVDLSETQFAQLTPLWRGVVRVKVSW